MSVDHKGTIKEEKSKKNEKLQRAHQVKRELWEELYTKKQEGWLTMLSGSMYPVIPVNAAILVKPVSLSKIRLGDIITFKEKEKIISHWVIGINREENKLRFIQQGNLCSSASIIDGNSILGRVFVVKHREKTIILDSAFNRCKCLKKSLLLRIKYEFRKLIKNIT